MLLLNPFKELQLACMVSGRNNTLLVYLIIKWYYDHVYFQRGYDFWAIRAVIFTYILKFLCTYLTLLKISFKKSSQDGHLKFISLILSFYQ